MPQKIAVFNRQRRVRFDLRWLKEFAAVALRECGHVEHLPEIEVSIVSDTQIAEAHQRFMNIRGPTDVITFQHGEILISADTAEHNAREYHQPLEAELGLYLIHGLLHLHGYDDRTAAAAKRMRAVQQRLLEKCLLLAKTPRAGTKPRRTNVK